MERGASQSEQILDWLKAGHSLTALEALERFKCFRLAARIGELKETPDGREIKSEMVFVPSGKKVARYWLPQERGQLSLFQMKTPGGAYQPGV
jgi:hypothetical protein